MLGANQELLAKETESNGQLQLDLSLAPERHIYEVSELSSAIQSVFEEEFSSIWVSGEISGCRLAASGHYYFSLKDSSSQVRCALFKGSAKYTKCKPQDGMAVLARGNLEVYEARGEYQLIVESLEPQGAGSLQLAFEQLKSKLAAEGLFEASRKRPLPKLPSRIGLVTSPNGAVLRDILQILQRRFSGLHIRLFPAQVQGEGSVEQICSGISYFSASEWAHVVIVARGGGSLEDLWSFNEERVARAIAASRVPIISAVGHETDFTIADFVADHRAPTPSAAAEIVICTRESLLEQIVTYQAKMGQVLRYRLAISSLNLHQRVGERAMTLMERILARRSQRVDEADGQLRDWAQEKLETSRRRYVELSRRLQDCNMQLRFERSRHKQEMLEGQLWKAWNARICNAQRRAEEAHASLVQLSPLAVLRRGYAIVENTEGRVLRSSLEADAGEQIKIRLHQGELDATVSGVRNSDSL
jgi:exodeoxyribonuclease VII large subunit